MGLLRLPETGLGVIIRMVYARRCESSGARALRHGRWRGGLAGGCCSFSLSLFEACRAFCCSWVFRRCWVDVLLDFRSFWCRWSDRCGAVGAALALCGRQVFMKPSGEHEREERQMSLMGWAAATAVVLQARCPVPTNDGMCGYASQVSDPSNGCCDITGPGQIQRVTCKGSGGTTDCVNTPRRYLYSFTKYFVRTNQAGDWYCGLDDAGKLPLLGCGPSGANPETVEIWCNSARSLSSSNCRDGSSG